MYVSVHLLKPIERTLRVNPKVNYGLWVIMMCQYKFILGDKYTILVRDVHNGKGYACGGQGLE